MLDQLNSMETEERQNKYIAVMEWIAGAPTNMDHESACEARKEDPSSGRWILTKPVFKIWKEADTPGSSILWLKGMPGAGTLTLLLQRSKAVLYARLL